MAVITAPTSASSTARAPWWVRASGNRLAVVCLIGATLCAAVWVRAGIMMADRAFDVTDEGFYALSYRWWDTNLRNFTAAQYLYGPVFEALDHDIASLRLFRLMTVLASAGLFGWSFVQWVRARRRSSSPVWEAAAVAAVVAAGGMMFSWLPLSPGYNDLTGLGAFLGAALVLRTATRVELGQPIPWWLPAALGLVCLAMVMARWTAVAAAALLVMSSMVVGARAGWATPLRILLWSLGSALLGTLAIHLFVVGLDDAIPALLAVNRLSSGADHTPGVVLNLYWDSIVDLAKDTLVRHWPLFAAALLAGLVNRGRAGFATGALGVGVLAYSVTLVAANDGLLGGPPHRGQFASGLLALGVTVALVWIGATISRVPNDGWTRPRAATVVPVALLLVLPLAVALGTNNPLWWLAVSVFSLPLAFMIHALTDLDPRAVGARALTLATIGVGVVASSLIAQDAFLHHPYRAVGYDRATTVVGDGTTPLGSLRVTPTEAQQYAALRESLAPYLAPAPAPILALDKMPGLVLLLGGRPVGEPWTGPTARSRSAAGLLDECRSGRLSRPPILLFNRTPDDRDRVALAACGYDLTRDYRPLGLTTPPPDLVVYVPRG